MLSDRGWCLCHFWWIVQALVLLIWGLLLKFGEHSMFWNILYPFHLYITYMVPKRRDIVKIVQFLLIDLPKFRFTELGSKLAILLCDDMQNFHKCQKEYVPAFYKNNSKTIMYPFFCPLVYIWDKRLGKILRKQIFPSYHNREIFLIRYSTKSW